MLRKAAPVKALVKALRLSQGQEHQHNNVVAQRIQQQLRRHRTQRRSYEVEQMKAEEVSRANRGRVYGQVFSECNCSGQSGPAAAQQASGGELARHDRG